MKRMEWMTDNQWDQAMELRKTIAERRMSDSDDAHGFFTLAEIGKASQILFGKNDPDSECKAENWLCGRYSEEGQ